MRCFRCNTKVELNFLPGTVEKYVGVCPHCTQCIYRKLDELGPDEIIE